MKTTYNGYDVSTKSGQMDLAYKGLIDPNKRLVIGSKPQATESDKQRLAEKGIEGLQELGLFGVLDRLANSGLI